MCAGEGGGFRCLAARVGQTACKPGSVPLPRKRGNAAAIPLDRPLRDGSRDQPGRLGPATALPASKEAGASSLFGLAPGGACHAVPVARSAVGPYPTLSPLPLALLTREGRFAFCGAVPGIAPGGRYPPPCRRGARTFLPLPVRKGATARPSGPSSEWAGMTPGSTGQSGLAGPGPAQPACSLSKAISRARLSPSMTPSTRSARQ